MLFLVKIFMTEIRKSLFILSLLFILKTDVLFVLAENNLNLINKANEYECVLINEDPCRNEYLYSVEQTKVTTYYRRMVFTSSSYYPLQGFNFCSILSDPSSEQNTLSSRTSIEFKDQNDKRIWILTPIQHKNNTFFIKNYFYKEYLYAAESFFGKNLAKNMSVYTWKADIDKTNEIYMWTFHKLAKEKYSIVNVKLNASLIVGSSFYHIKEYERCHY